MKLYIEEKVVNIPADNAWKALKEMDVWEEYAKTLLN